MKRAIEPQDVAIVNANANFRAYSMTLKLNDHHPLSKMVESQMQKPIPSTVIRDLLGGALSRQLVHVISKVKEGKGIILSNK